MPAFTHYKVQFQGTLDHLFYSADQLEVTQLLEIPKSDTLKREKAIPSTMFPSDHFRIEAIFNYK